MSANEKKRYTITCDADVIARYAAKKEMNDTDFIKYCINFTCKYMDHNYDLPDIMTMRINQLYEMFQSINGGVRLLDDKMTENFNQLNMILRGSDYLNDDDNELGQNA